MFEVVLLLVLLLLLLLVVVLFFKTTEFKDDAVKGNLVFFFDERGRISDGIRGILMLVETGSSEG